MPKTTERPSAAWAALLEFRPSAQWEVQCHLTTRLLCRSPGKAPIISTHGYANSVGSRRTRILCCLGNADPISLRTTLQSRSCSGPEALTAMGSRGQHGRLRARLPSRSYRALHCSPRGSGRVQGGRSPAMARDGSIPSKGHTRGWTERPERVTQTMQFDLRIQGCGESSFESYAMKTRVWGRPGAFLQPAGLPSRWETLSKPRSPTDMFSWL